MANSKITAEYQVVQPVNVHPPFSPSDVHILHQENLVDDDVSACCPSMLSCFLSTILPCQWLCSCVQVNYREELVMLNWGKFLGVKREPGIHIINQSGLQVLQVSTALQSIEIQQVKVVVVKSNPLIVGGVVTYQILDTRKAALDVSSWRSYLQTQAEVVLKQICSSHPYESRIEGEDSLKREADKVRKEIVQRLQAKVSVAGITVANFEFKELSYAPEIASQMLVRQQAEAMLDARKVVVEGGVSIAWEAVSHLKSAGLVIADAEATRLAGNLVLAICSESRITPTMQLS